MSTQLPADNPWWYKLVDNYPNHDNYLKANVLSRISNYRLTIYGGILKSYVLSRIKGKDKLYCGR